MNRLFGSFFDQPAGQPPAALARRWVPAMDLLESDGAYILRADLPGLGSDEVTVEFEDNVLTISGERASAQEQRAEGYHRIERASGSFSRSLTLPAGIDAEAIEAGFVDGVLEVRIPLPQQRKARRVAIATPADVAGPLERTQATDQAEDSSDSSPQQDSTPQTLAA
jgi:HSP20 family protein